MPPEKTPKTQFISSSEGLSQNELFSSKMKEDCFHMIVAEKMVDTYENEMKNFGFSQKQISEFRNEILLLTPVNEDLLYAFPWELKQRALPSFLKKINEGNETIKSMIEKIITASKSGHRKIAFHASNENITPKETRGLGQAVKEWAVKGTENDHRDNDLPMAYYSFDYANLYRQKNPKYIYAVSIQEDEKSGHRKDGNNQWGRAPSLSVIEKFDLKDIETQALALYEQKKKAIGSKELNGLAA